MTRSSRSLSQGIRRRTHGALDRVRHARHPLHGWRKWAVIGLQGLAFLVGVFALINLVLSLSVQSGDDLGRRAVHEVQALWFSALDGWETDPEAFAAIYGDELGDDPSADEVHAYFAERRHDRSILLDQVMIGHVEKNFGRLDSRSFPTGVYVGVRALGPDGMPFVPVTKYMAHFLLFPRHAYILVVPEEGEAKAFSASLNGHFDDETDEPDRLAAEITAYDSAAYDYPSSGQAIHELTLIEEGAEAAEAALGRLTAARDRLEERRIPYGVLAPNSNTVIGCILEDSGVMTRRERSSAILTARAPGVGAACR